MSPAPRIFIIVRAPNGDVREVPVTAQAIVIGRDESADIRVEDKKVSRRHAGFKLVDGEPWVEDLGSANGVKVNGKRIDKRAKIKSGDKVKVGGYLVTLRELEAEPDSAVADRPVGGTEARAQVEKTAPPVEGTRAKKRVGPADDGRSPVLEGLDEPVKGERFVLRPGENIVGRLEECDVPVLDASVSRQHARLLFAKNRVSVVDLGASNGTFVNGDRVEMAELAQGDTLRIGNISFRVELPPGLSAAAPVRTRARAKKEKSSSRPWATLGIAVLLVAVAVLSATVYWKWRLRQAQSALAQGELGGTQTATQTAAARPPPDASGAPPEAPRPPPPEAPRPPTSAVDAGVAAPAVAGELATRTVSTVRTATSPYGRRDPATGLPLDLPPVDPAFDLDAFVGEQLALVRTLEQEKAYPKLREVLAALLDRDPINREARGLLKRLLAEEQSEVSFREAEEAVGKGELGRAMKLYASIPAEAPRGAEAKEKLGAIRVRAIEQELARADEDAKQKATWARAHRRYKDVLEVDPESIRALEGVRGLEKRMRAKNVRFAAYVRPGAQPERERETPAEINEAIDKLYGGDDELARAARAYVQGPVSTALRRSEALERRSDKDKRERARFVSRTLKEIQALHVRIQNEVSNDPHEAWKKLTDLETLEERILPAGISSYLKRELSGNVAAALAERGTSSFDRGRYEDAFTHWAAGNKLDPTNPKILAGLKALEEKAKQYADEAELAAQRGDREVCNRWRAITRMTRPESELYQRITQRSQAACR